MLFQNNELTYRWKELRSDSVTGAAFEKELMDHNRNKYKSSENAAVDLPDAIPEVEMYEDDDLKAS